MSDGTPAWHQRSALSGLVVLVVLVLAFSWTSAPQQELRLWAATPTQGPPRPAVAPAPLQRSPFSLRPLVEHTSPIRRSQTRGPAPAKDSMGLNPALDVRTQLTMSDISGPVLGVGAAALMVAARYCSVLRGHGGTRTRLPRRWRVVSTSSEDLVLAPTGPWALAAVTGRKPLLAASAVGAAVTAYIILWKATGGGPTVCGSESCADVLSGPYSSLFGVPLAVPGFAAYSLMAVLTLLPEGEEEAGKGLPSQALMTISAAMATFSTYLTSLLLFGLGTVCPLCLTSATSSWVAAGLAWAGGERVPSKRRRDILTLAVTTALATSIVHYVASEAAFEAASPVVDADASPLYPPPIETTSSGRVLQLVPRMQALNARMYGAFWCSHCNGQKRTLGREAFEALPYVECDPRGANQQRETCKAVGITGYPTWEIQGVLLSGEKSVGELEAIVKAAEEGRDLQEAADAAYLAYQKSTWQREDE
uniref:Vitamin K epoxide reductase domain-containing protein n=1 Tax=Eutreptiella gymnastica TaxID=73025 RepID=A0A7S1HWX1_9EUGL